MLNRHAGYNADLSYKVAKVEFYAPRMGAWIAPRWNTTHVEMLERICVTCYNAACDLSHQPTADLLYAEFTRVDGILFSQMRSEPMKPLHRSYAGC